MPRYKAIVALGFELQAVRKSLHNRGAHSLYYANAEDAIFFETDEQDTVSAVQAAHGVERVVLAGD